MGTYRNINVRNLVLSSIIQYASSIASYYVGNEKTCAWSLDHVIGDFALVLDLQHVQASLHHSGVGSVLREDALRVELDGHHHCVDGLESGWIVIVGAVMYNLNSKRGRNRRKSPELKANRELSYMDLKTITLWDCKVFLFVYSLSFFSFCLFVGSHENSNFPRFLAFCDRRVYFDHGRGSFHKWTLGY